MGTTAETLLDRRGSVPHFSVRDRTGAVVHYADIWQQRALVLVCLPSFDDRDARQYAATLSEQATNISALDGACVVTSDRVRGLSRPGALVADRWGEIVFAAHPADVPALPHPPELVEWLHFAQIRCPECEGEAR